MRYLQGIALAALIVAALISVRRALGTPGRIGLPGLPGASCGPPPTSAVYELACVSEVRGTSLYGAGVAAVSVMHGLGLTTGGTWRATAAQRASILADMAATVACRSVMLAPIGPTAASA